MVAAGHADKETEYNARGQQILSVARELFMEKGYDGTSIRDIADAIDIKTASIYYYFLSKEDLFVEVMRLGLNKISVAVREALREPADPWTNLERAAMAHCDAMLGTEGFRVLVAPKLPATLSAEGVRRINGIRNAFQRLITGVVEELPLPPGTNRKIFLFTYLAAINGTPIWYSEKGPLSPAQIAREIVSVLRHA